MKQLDLFKQQLESLTNHERIWYEACISHHSQNIAKMGYTQVKGASDRTSDIREVRQQLIKNALARRKE